MARALIGASAAYGMALAAREDSSAEAMRAAANRLLDTRPTAVNLQWAVEQVLEAVAQLDSSSDRARVAMETADAIADEDVQFCRKIGEQGLPIIREIAERRAGQPVRILTHCNAGWLAFVDYGTATGPIYLAHDSGIPVSVWVQETRPRSQGARLTAWELARHGVPASVIVDNAGGHVMQQKQVDLVITGTDRTTSNGDVCNKVGTYKTALAARDNDIPFYVALPDSSIDWSLSSGHDIPIEERHPEEVTHVESPDGPSPMMDSSLTVRNFAFDVTPARLITGLITGRGVCTPEGLAPLYGR